MKNFCVMCRAKFERFDEIQFSTKINRFFRLNSDRKQRKCALCTGVHREIDEVVDTPFNK